MLKAPERLGRRTKKGLWAWVAGKHQESSFQSTLGPEAGSQRPRDSVGADDVAFQVDENQGLQSKLSTSCPRLSRPSAASGLPIPFLSYPLPQS